MSANLSRTLAITVLLAALSACLVYLTLSFTAGPAQAQVDIEGQNGARIQVGNGCVAITGTDNDIFVGGGCEERQENNQDPAQPPETSPVSEPSEDPSSGGTTTMPETTIGATTTNGTTSAGTTAGTTAGTINSALPTEEVAGGTEISAEEYEILEGLLNRCQSGGSTDAGGVSVDDPVDSADPEAQKAAEEALAAEGLGGQEVTSTKSLTPEQCDLLAEALSGEEPLFTNSSLQQPVEDTCPVEPPDTAVPATVESVTDGDTIELSEPIQDKTSVRLIGVDTPETVDPETDPEPYGKEASDYTTEQLEGQEVLVEVGQEPEDDYGRLLAYVYTDDGMFNESLLEQGYAELMTIEPNDTYETCLSAAEERAKAEGAGLWSDEEPVAPNGPQAGTTVEQPQTVQSGGGTTVGPASEPEPETEEGIFSIFGFGNTTEGENTASGTTGAENTGAAGTTMETTAATPAPEQTEHPVEESTTELPVAGQSSGAATLLPDEPVEAVPAPEPIKDEVPPVDTLSDVVPVEEPEEPQPELAAELPVEESGGESIDYLPTTGGVPLVVLLSAASAAAACGLLALATRRSGKPHTAAHPARSGSQGSRSSGKE